MADRHQPVPRPGTRRRRRRRPARRCARVSGPHLRDRANDRADRHSHHSGRRVQAEAAAPSIRVAEAGVGATNHRTQPGPGPTPPPRLRPSSNGDAPTPRATWPRRPAARVNSSCRSGSSPCQDPAPRPAPVEPASPTPASCGGLSPPLEQRHISGRRMTGTSRVTNRSRADGRRECHGRVSESRS